MGATAHQESAKSRKAKAPAKRRREGPKHMQHCVQADLTRDAVESSVGFFLRLAFSSFRTKLACILLGSAQKTKAPFQGLGVPIRERVS